MISMLTLIRGIVDPSPTMLLPTEPLSVPPTMVVLSWNGQPPSARAIKAAIPFARRAQRVVVLEHAGNEVNRSRLEGFLASRDIKPADWRAYGGKSLTARGCARFWPRPKQRAANSS